MKFIASSTELLVYLQSLSKIVPSRSIVPLVENFLFEITNEGLKITATDLETTLIAHIELSNIEGQGKFAIESKRLLDILKEFSQQPLTFEIDEETFEVTIKSETGKYNIPGVSAVDEYPEPAEITPDQTNSFVTTPEILLKGINSTFFSISDDELRPVMNGIFVELKNDYTTFVTSDSHKLVRYRRMDIKSDTEASFILPKKPADIIRNILPKIDEDIIVEFDNSNAIFKMTGFTVVCRLIEGNFPDYEGVIPTNNDKKIEIDKNNLLNTLKRVSLFSNEASKLVKFYFHDNQAEISAQDIDFSISAFEQIPCLTDEVDMKIGYKSTFLQDVLQNITAQEITITMTDQKRASLVFPSTKDDENEDVLMLVMPMMIDED